MLLGSVLAALVGGAIIRFLVAGEREMSNDAQEECFYKYGTHPLAKAHQ
jgi:hypothetical protein